MSERQEERLGEERQDRGQREGQSCEKRGKEREKKRGKLPVLPPPVIPRRRRP